MVSAPESIRANSFVSLNSSCSSDDIFVLPADIFAVWFGSMCLFCPDEMSALTCLVVDLSMDLIDGVDLPLLLEGHHPASEVGLSKLD